jgi:hypothetical protein
LASDSPGSGDQVCAGQGQVGYYDGHAVVMTGPFDYSTRDDPIIDIEVNWYPSFALLPHRTINGRWIWLRRCFKRRVWRGSDVSFHIEPFTEYADTLFDILAEDHGHE